MMGRVISVDITGYSGAPDLVERRGEVYPGVEREDPLEKAQTAAICVESRGDSWRNSSSD